ETRAARCWSSQNPGAPSSSSCSAIRRLSPSGSKVITDPGELGPDLLELLLQRLLRRLAHSVEGSERRKCSSLGTKMSRQNQVSDTWFFGPRRWAIDPAAAVQGSARDGSQPSPRNTDNRKSSRQRLRRCRTS